MARRNPAPLSGALFVRNPRRRNAIAVQANRQAVSRLLRRIKAKGGKRGTRKGMRRKTARRAYMRTNNAWSLRRNGLRRRANGRFASLRRNRRGTRKGMRRRTARRAYMKTYGGRPPQRSRGRGRGRGRRRGTRKGMRRRTARRAFMRSNRRRNRTRKDLTAQLGGTLTRLTKQVPLVGKTLAPYITPALTGSLSFVPIHYALQWGEQWVPPVLKPFSYTTAGFVVATIAAMLPKGVTRTFKGILGTTAVATGAAIDTFRYFSGTSNTLGAIDLPGYGAIDFPGYTMNGLGDGMAYDISGFGGLAIQGGDMGAMTIMGDYSDAVMADAAWSGPDLSSWEGEAALKGPGPWRRRFKRPAHRAKGQQQAQSRHAGKQGHRWGWLIKLVGWENFRRIAALPAPQRTAFIDKLRKDAVAAVVGLTEADVQIETGGNSVAGLALDLQGLGSHIYAGAAY